MLIGHKIRSVMTLYQWKMLGSTSYAYSYIGNKKAMNLALLLYPDSFFLLSTLLA